ncbi:MAG: CPBP family intramembrane metalloprotease [Ruminococcus sp.]|nr:CPBP family intramembrane metalloprotease [Ruminococcus sp.]MBR2303876.1 CPBP family intramembrane metalloprotease [Ruminococcus sp.]
MKKALPLLLPVRSVVFALIFIVGSRLVGKDVSEISRWWTPAATIVNILTVMLIVFAAKKNGQTYRELINYEKGKTTKKQVVLVTLMILLVGMGGMYLAGYICYGVIPYGAPMMIAPIPKALALINLVLLPVTTALAEDGMYLGCGVNSIENKLAAILIPAFFFALQHCYIPTLFDSKYMLYRFISFLPLTIILCAYYHKKRNPLPIMIGHAVIDLATAGQIIATSFIPGFYEKMCSM